MKRIAQVVVLTIAVFGLALAIASAQEQRSKQDRTFEGYEEVLEVQVPVNVLDKNGRPLHGLTAEDFTVTEGKKTHEISAFEVVDLEMLGPEVTAKRAGDVIPAAARRHILLLFDLAFSDPQSIVTARRAASEFVLNNLHPTDLVAVATHSVETGPRLIVTFTPDRTQLARAIDTLGAPRLLSGRRDPLSFLIDVPNAGGVQTDGGEDTNASQQARNQEAQVANHLRVLARQFQKVERNYERGRVFSWSSSMAEMARILDSVAGRKQVVYFSEGFDGMLLFGRDPDPDDEDFRADLANKALGNLGMIDTDDWFGNTALQGSMEKMLQSFRRADCVIQAVNISGLNADRPAERRGSKLGQDALFYMANETGGELFQEANNIGAGLIRALDNTSLTYLLTIRPTGVLADGSYHELKVEADGLPKGSRLSYRTGFYAPRPYQELHPLEKTLLASDAIAAAEIKNEIGANILAAPFRTGGGQAYVPVITEIDGEGLLVGHETSILPVEIYAYATDAAGQMQDFFAQVLTVNVGGQRDLFAAGGLKYYGHMDLVPGNYTVRVLIRNSETGRAGIQVVDLEIPQFGEGEPVLLPPFVADRGGEWHLVREKGDYQGSVIYPFTLNGDPYVPAARPKLDQDESVDLRLVAYNLGEGSIRLDGDVLDHDGILVAEAVAIGPVERTITGIHGLDKLVAKFQPRGLDQGDYELQVSLRDPESGALSTSTLPFSVLN